MDFGTPVPVTDLPPASKRGGRVSNDEAYATWLSQLQPGSTYELASTEDDQAHPVNRVTQIRKVVKERFPGQFKIDTRPVEPGKRYRIYATVTA